MKKRASITCSTFNFLLVALAIPQKYFVYGYVSGGLVWSRKLNSFIPFANVSTFAEMEQEFFRKSRELETHNFRREILRLGYYEEKNLFSFYDNDSKVTGIVGEIWNMLAEYSNFSLNVTKVEKFGTRQPNGTYDGFVGMLQRKEIEIIPRTGFYIMEMKVMDYTTPIWANKYRVYIQPESKSNSVWIFKMFSRNVWCSIFLIFVLISVFGYTTQKISIKVSNDEKIQHDFHDHIFYTFATLCNQGFIPDTLYQRIKILSLTKKMFAWLLLIALSSHLISYMTSQKVELPFYDLISMLNLTSYKIVVFEGSMILDKFKVTMARSASEKEIQERVVYVNTTKKLYEKICSGKKKYAIMESEDRHRAYGKYVCKLVPVGVSYFPTWVTSGVVKDFKYKRTLDIGILKLNEFGLTDGMKDRWMEKISEGYDESAVQSIDFEQIFMLLMIFFMGIVASVAIFVLENAVFVYKYNRRKAFSRILLK